MCDGYITVIMAGLRKKDVWNERSAESNESMDGEGKGAETEMERLNTSYHILSNSSYLSALNSFTPKRDYTDKLLYHQSLM